MGGGGGTYTTSQCVLVGVGYVVFGFGANESHLFVSFLKNSVAITILYANNLCVVVKGNVIVLSICVSNPITLVCIYLLLGHHRRMKVRTKA